MKSSVFFLALLLMLLSGCQKNDVGSFGNDVGSNNSGMTVIDPSEIITQERDAGVIRQRTNFDFIFDMQGVKEIEKVVLSCGCTGLPVKAGDIIDFSKPLIVDIDLSGKPSGTSVQTFLLSFTDGTIVLGKVKYDHVPLPFYTPQNLIFQGSEDSKELTLTYFEEKNVVLKESILPQCITMTEKERIEDEEKIKIVILFTLDRSVNTADSQGIIQISCSSTTTSEFRIPYLILKN
jgi:hypothetical protein